MTTRDVIYRITFGFYSTRAYSACGYTPNARPT